MIEWIDLYRSQPWLVKQESEEEQKELEREVQRSAIDQNQEIIAKQRADVELASASVEDMGREVNALQLELVGWQTATTRLLTSHPGDRGAV